MNPQQMMRGPQPPMAQTGWPNAPPSQPQNPGIYNGNSQLNQLPAQMSGMNLGPPPTGQMPMVPQGPLPGQFAPPPTSGAPMSQPPTFPKMGQPTATQQPFQNGPPASHLNAVNNNVAPPTLVSQANGFPAPPTQFNTMPQPQAKPQMPPNPYGPPPGMATQRPPSQMPPGQMPGSQMPPGGQMPGSQMPPGQMPGSQMPPGGQMPGSQMPPGQMPPGQMPPSQMPPGQMPPSQMPPGQMPPSQMPPGQMPPMPNQPPQQYPGYQSSFQGAPQYAQQPGSMPPGAQHYPTAQGYPGGAPQMPQVPQQRRLDPDQMPNPIQVMGENQRSCQGPFVTNQPGLVPPLVTTKFITHDQGNSGPRFVRSTMYSVPSTTDMMKQTAVPFALIISPFAKTLEGEMTPPIVDFGEVGPIRCIRCKLNNAREEMCQATCRRASDCAGS